MKSFAICAVAPSIGARPEKFRIDREKAPIHCNRPQDIQKTLPLRLLHPVFGNFLDDCESFKPASKDEDFLYKFVTTMTNFYDKEIDRQTAILELFIKANIVMQPNEIIGTKHTTDGSAFFDGRHIYMLAESKNEVCSTNCEPYLQAVLYYLEATRKCTSEYPRSNLPCIIFGMFTWACLSYTHTKCA